MKMQNYLDVLSKFEETIVLLIDNSEYDYKTQGEMTENLYSFTTLIEEIIEKIKGEQHESD